MKSSMHVTGESLDVLAKALRGETIRRQSMNELLICDLRLILPDADEIALGAMEAASVTLSAISRR